MTAEGNGRGLTILAVDDERPALEDLARLLRSIDAVGRVDVAEGGDEALLALSERPYDGLFLDVRMPGLDGLELAAVLRRFARAPAVVFVTAYEDAAVEAFALHALDYLMKPASRRRVEEAIARISVAAAGSDAGRHAATPAGAAPDPEVDVVPVNHARGGGTRLVPRASILYLQAHGDYVRIVSDEGRFLLRGRLSDIERRWEAFGFVRVHRGFLANLRRAVELRPMLNGTAMLVFANDAKIPVARRQVGDLRRRLGA